LAIIRIGDDAYGVSISNEIEEITGSAVILISVYDALTRLREKGSFHRTSVKPPAARGGKAKRHYRTTAKGIRVVRETHRN